MGDGLALSSVLCAISGVEKSSLDAHKGVIVVTASYQTKCTISVRVGVLTTSGTHFHVHR
jgi:hypothetical protein